MRPMSMSRPLALVTGASAGIGKAFSERLARDGYDLIVTARRQDRLDDLAARLHAEFGAAVEVLVADLAKPDGVSAVCAAVAQRPFDLVVNNAGFGAYRPFAELDPQVADDLLSVHIRAVVQVTRAALPGMLAQNRGSIVNVASLLALSSSIPPGGFLPARAVYAGAKSFLLAFSQIVAGELASTNVRVQVCLPGIVKTEFHEVQGMDTSRMPPRMPPEDVVTASLAALGRNEAVCVPALEDAALLRTVEESQRAVLASTSKATLAKRYA